MTQIRADIPSDQTTSASGPASGGSSGGEQRVIAALRRLRTRIKLQLFVQRAALAIAGTVGAALVLALLDYVLVFPVALRWFHYVMLWAGLTVGLVRWLRPVIKFNPGLTDLALRIERQPGAREAGLPGVLAAGAEFARSPKADGDARGEGDSGGIKSYITLQAGERYAAFARRASVMDRRMLMRGLACVAAAAACVLGLAALTPELTSIGASRTLTPWRAVNWPKLTQVAIAPTPSAHALGSALPLRAVLVRTNKPQGQTPVKLYYTVTAGGERSAVRSALMTAQGRTVRAASQAIAGVPDSSVTADDVTDPSQNLVGELYERLLDPDMLTLSTQQAPGEAKITFWFATADDETPPTEVTIVPPPAVVAATADVTLPAYAAGLEKSDGPGGLRWLSGATQVLGRQVQGDVSNNISDSATPRGLSGAGVLGPVLAGSRVQLDLTFNKPMWVAAPPVLSEVLPGLESLEGAVLTSVGEGGTKWRVTGVAQQPVRAPIVLVDDLGIRSDDDASLRIDVVEDRPPAAAIIDPPQDEAVLASASVPVSGQGRDDVGIAEVYITSQTAVVPTDSAGAAPEPSGEPVTLLASTPEMVGKAEVTLTSTIDISTLGVKPGDEVLVVAGVRDMLVSSASGAPVLSPTRRLMIISEGDLIEQVQAELSGVREAAKRAEEEQSKLSSQRERAKEGRAQAGEQSARQERLSERLTPMGDAVKRLGARLERNKLDDAALTRMLEDAGTLAQEAKQASDAAADALDRLAAQAEEDRAANPAVEAAGEQAKQAQEAAAERLADLAAILDQGQDDWVVRRAIEKMALQQEQLRRRAATLEESLRGKNANELSQQEAEDVERLAREQREMSAQANAMVASMEERAAQLEKNDPAQAQGLKEAANTARNQRLSDQQTQAATQIQQNNTSEAQKSQRKAEQTLEQMKRQLDKAEQNRDQALRRVLADVTESIQKLVSEQERALAKLSAVMAGTERTTPAGLSVAMMTLHENTLAVQTKVKDEVRGADESLLPLLTSAGQAQTAAIVALRQATPDLPEADANERTSLTRLREALEAAGKLDEEVEEREEDRKRDELKQLYSEATELQAAINAQTEPLYERALNRREGALARALGVRQEELRAKVDEIRSNAAEMAEAQLFVYAHTRYDQAAVNAREQLRLSVAPAAVKREQATALRVLQGMVAALEEAQRKKDEFREEEGGGGGGAGQGGGEGQKQPLIPPIAELRLLRAMQAEALERTRGLEGAVDEAAQGELVRTAELQSELAVRAGDLLKKLKEQQEAEEGEKPAAERN